MKTTVENIIAAIWLFLVASWIANAVDLVNCDFERPFKYETQNKVL